MAELLMVVTLVGITAALVVPKIDVPHYRIDAAMQAVGSTLMAAQREAVASQADVIVSFDTSARTLTLHWDADNDGTVDAGERTRTIALDDGVTFGRPSAVPARAFGTAAADFALVNGHPAVIFRRNGSASESGGLYLTSMRALTPGANRTDDTRAVELERSTGRADWYRYQAGWKRGF